MCQILSFVAFLCLGQAVAGARWKAMRIMAVFMENCKVVRKKVLIGRKLEGRGRRADGGVERNIATKAQR